MKNILPKSFTSSDVFYIAIFTFMIIFQSVPYIIFIIWLLFFVFIHRLSFSFEEEKITKFINFTNFKSYKVPRKYIKTTYTVAYLFIISFLVLQFKGEFNQYISLLFPISLAFAVGCKKCILALKLIFEKGLIKAFFLNEKFYSSMVLSSDKKDDDLISYLFYHIKVNYEYKLNLSENDIDEIIEDLKEFNIDSIEKFENRIIYAGKVTDDIENYASKLYAQKNKLDPNKFYKLENINYTDYLFFFEGKLEKRKPVSHEAFSNILESYTEKLWHGDIRKVLTVASLLTLENISSDTDPNMFELSDFDNFIEEVVFMTYEWTSNIEGLKDFLIDRITNEDEDSIHYKWLIGKFGETFIYDGEAYTHKYEDKESFLEDVNYSQVIKILKKCWDRACKTEEVFPEEEAMNERRNGFITWE